MRQHTTQQSIQPQHTRLWRDSSPSTLLSRVCQWCLQHGTGASSRLSQQLAPPPPRSQVLLSHTSLVSHFSRRTGCVVCVTRCRVVWLRYAYAAMPTPPLSHLSRYAYAALWIWRVADTAGSVRTSSSSTPILHIRTYADACWLTGSIRSWWRCTQHRTSTRSPSPVLSSPHLLSLSPLLSSSPLLLSSIYQLGIAVVYLLHVGVAVVYLVYVGVGRSCRGALLSSDEASLRSRRVARL